MIGLLHDIVGVILMSCVESNGFNFDSENKTEGIIRVHVKYGLDKPGSWQKGDAARKSDCGVRGGDREVIKGNNGVACGDGIDSGGGNVTVFGNGACMDDYRSCVSSVTDETAGVCIGW